jgi:3'-phosphoadenosine 5'-phosphosulfate sulfotransferase (PAPS reductase)/FAD synthetase
LSFEAVQGRKRYQGGGPYALELFEVDRPLGPDYPDVKVNPLARWNGNDLRDYITAHNLPHVIRCGGKGVSKRQ